MRWPRRPGWPVRAEPIGAAPGPAAPGPAAPGLAALQAQVVAALLAADAGAQGLPSHWFSGAVPPAESLRVHRNTVLGALAHALRQSYPALEQLVGEAYFDRLAVGFARVHPPAQPQLHSWGGRFAEFIAGQAGLAHLAFAGELARLEWQLDELGRCAPGEAAPPGAHGAPHPVDAAGDALPVGGGLAIRFAPSLRVLATRHPVLALREALLEGDAARVAALSANPGEHAQALWSAPAGVCTRTLHPAAARCLALLLAGEELPVALESARGALDEAAFMAIVRSDLLEAGFTTLAGA